MGGVDSDCFDGFVDVLKKQGFGYLLSGEEQVPFPSVEGKIICLAFSANWCRPCKTFTPSLVHVYNALKGTSRELEIIFISLDRDEKGFREHFKFMPWLAVPFDVELQKTLSNLYRVEQIPSFIPLGVHGKLIGKEAVGLIEEYGVEAFPFTKQRHGELKALDEAKRRGGNVEQLFSNGAKTPLISCKGGEVRATELVGKTIGLYFGAYWCPPCQKFSAQLIEAYIAIIANINQDFEVVYISTDRDAKEFHLSISKMPWLAIPFEDRTRQDLCRIFEIKGIPALVLIGRDGKTISTNGRSMVSLYGAIGFPFTESRISEIEEFLQNEGRELPSQVKDSKHEHVLKLDRVKAYLCDFCKKHGRFWAYSCDICDYDLHPTCSEDTRELLHNHVTV